MFRSLKYKIRDEHWNLINEEMFINTNGNISDMIGHNVTRNVYVNNIPRDMINESIYSGLYSKTDKV